MKMNFAAISRNRYLKYANAIVLIQLFPLAESMCPYLSNSAASSTLASRQHLSEQRSLAPPTHP